MKILLITTIAFSGFLIGSLGCYFSLKNEKIEPQSFISLDIGATYCWNNREKIFGISKLWHSPKIYTPQPNVQCIENNTSSIKLLFYEPPEFPVFEKLPGAKQSTIILME